MVTALGAERQRKTHEPERQNPCGVTHRQSRCGATAPAPLSARGPRKAVTFTQNEVHGLLNFYVLFAREAAHPGSVTTDDVTVTREAWERIMSSEPLGPEL